MIDCHIIVSADTNRSWVTQCLDSVYEAADRAGFPVHVHVVDGVPGHIGKARAAGYAVGTQPYVTCVDDDDWVEPDAFALLLGALKQHPVGATTHCNVHQNGRVWRAQRDNLRVFRRDIAESAPLAEWPVYDGPMMLSHARQRGEVIALTAAPYHYRLYLSKHRALAANADAEMVSKIRSLPRTH